MMMALTGHNEKTGKAGCAALRAAFTFSRLSGCSVISYADHPMPTSPKLQKLTVTWETVPDPDPYALLKAVALLFNRRVPLSTATDLTKPDKTLLCERPPDP